MSRFWIPVGIILAIVVTTIVVGFVIQARDVAACEAAGGKLVKGICLEPSAVIHP